MTSHGIPADLALLHSQLGLYARQCADVQKTRIAMELRIGAAERSGWPEEASLFLLDSLSRLEGLEDSLKQHLEKLAKQHPIYPFIAATPGISAYMFARLFGVTGPLDRYATVSKLWKFLGMAVTPEGTAPRRKKGVPFTHTACDKDDHPQCINVVTGTAYTPEGKVVAHLIGQGFVLVNKGPYRAAYDLKRAEYLSRPRSGPSLCPMGQTHRSETGAIAACVKAKKEGGESSAHLDNAAMRYAAKQFLKDLWVAWHRIESAS